MTDRTPRKLTRSRTDIALMCCSIENNLTVRKAVVLAILLLSISAHSADCCQNCESRMRRVEDTELKFRKLPAKKDIFMSRGWGAGGGTAFTSRTNSDMYKQNRMLTDLMTNDKTNFEFPMEPRVEFLRSPVVSKPIAERRRQPVYAPQLFISSGWGPLGK
ncbi:hypothetical protein GE061_013707 [Apolygus lucorum]|uniref:Uncharacterized protein n=1 Tax=Apolygus lucorum TaxID=248454 RepID=A0A6A4K303_APOLU|nr:hypothetical protein GE061_013707 [Apolygus lucorum]